MLLEEGPTARAAKAYDESNAALDKADDLFQAADDKAKVRLSREAYAALVSPAALDYEGWGYDRIMTNVYKALNYLEMGRKDDARVEIKRIADSQERCEERYKNKIAQAEKARNETTEVDADLTKVRKDDQFPARANRRSSPTSATLPASRPCRNFGTRRCTQTRSPNTCRACSTSTPAPGDAELGRTSMRNVAGMVGDKPAVRNALRDAEAAANASTTTPQTYVIFETGIAPARRDPHRPADLRHQRGLSGYEGRLRRRGVPRS